MTRSIHTSPPPWVAGCDLHPVRSRASVQVVLGSGVVVDGGVEVDDDEEDVMYEESINIARCGGMGKGDGGDEEEEMEGEKEGGGGYGPPIPLMKVVSRLEDGRKVIGFGKGDPENPYNWPLRKRYWLTFLGIMQVTNSTFTSSITSGAAAYIADEFHLPPESLLRTLPISVFLVGYIVGPIAMGPLSEYYGRRWMVVCGFLWFLVWSIGSAVAPTLVSFLIMRFLCGLGASVPLTIVGAVYADIWDDSQTRGRFIALFCAATSVGPLVTPAISGFVSASHMGWRFSMWVAVILAGLTAIPICFFAPETFGPVLLLKKARRLRKETGDDLIVAPMELDSRKVSTILANSCATPFKMCFTEAIVGLSSLYIGLVYGTFYLSFQSYPIIFQGKYGFSPGLAGLAFMSMGIGSVMSYPAVLAWDKYLLRRARLHPNQPFSEEFRRLPVACLGGTFFFLSLFWLGWSGNSGKVHWIVPVMSGIPFGFGYVLVFIACMNYITDAYGVYSAGGLAANSMVRSLFGAALPLATGKMYKALGVGGATSILGGAALVLTGVPFLFLKFGDRIRANSKFCQQLLELKAQQAERDERAAQHELQGAATSAVSATPSTLVTSSQSSTIGAGAGGGGGGGDPEKEVAMGRVQRVVRGGGSGSESEGSGRSGRSAGSESSRSRSRTGSTSSTTVVPVRKGSMPRPEEGKKSRSKDEEAGGGGGGSYV